MKKVLVLGAGLVAKPLVIYLLDREFHVTVASRTVSKAEVLVGDHENGRAISWTVDKTEELRNMISEHDLVVSLLPYTFHVQVANICLEFDRHLVTTSYVSGEMKALDGPAKAKNLIFLNECGLDPGMDHMSAMKVIHDVKRRGGKVVSFRSTTGALPAFEANNNPFGYKFSWAPRGVLLASKNASKWLQDGEVVEFSGEELFENYFIQNVEGVGAFENYPNRDSVPYKDIYGLKDAKTVYRGTFRMTGWCETMRNVVALGWLDEEPLEGFSGKTYRDVTGHLIGASSNDDLAKAAADFLNLRPYATVIKRLEWLGLFSDAPLPADRDNPLDYLNVLTLEKMSLGDDERDMIIMHHEFVAEFPDGKESITSTFLDFGIPGGETSIARTVSTPAAIAVRMILDGKINEPGVHIPVSEGIYNPILDELANLGMVFREHVEKI